MRTLSKSDFKLARTCDAKLFFRENGYPDSRARDPYLALLAEGGYMVEALAKSKYPTGIPLSYGSDVIAEAAQTLALLKNSEATLFEATLLVGRRQARVDALEKRGNTVRIIEMKAKSFDSAEHAANKDSGGLGVFRSSRKPFGILSKWREKLEDITYQVILLEKTLPGVVVRPYLALVDKSKRATIDRIPDLFELVRQDKDGLSRLYTARYIGTQEQLSKLDLVTEVDVAAEVAILRADVEVAASRFESLLDKELRKYQEGLQRGSWCSDCEFRLDEPSERDGFRDCWGTFAAAEPHMLELYSIGKAHGPDRRPLVEWMLSEGTASLLDIPKEGLVKADGDVGKEAARQLRQIAHTRSGKEFIGRSLRPNIEALRSPLHFVDFETSGLALPYHAGMRPYGVVTFQWSCHSVATPGDRPTHSEYLNTVDLWPNQTFAESLRAAIGDDGHVLTWSTFENTKLKQIVSDLAEFGRHEPELVAWMQRVETRIVDLYAWARDDYYHPAMKGKAGIKYVIDALWKTDRTMRDQFEQLTALRADPARDPYSALPTIEIDDTPQFVREGTGAMRAYEAMMYGVDRNNAGVKDAWATLLKQYCHLDTLSMFLIFEYWRRATGLA